MIFLKKTERSFKARNQKSDLMITVKCPNGVDRLRCMDHFSRHDPTLAEDSQNFNYSRVVDRQKKRNLRTKSHFIVCFYFRLEFHYKERIPKIWGVWCTLLSRGFGAENCQFLLKSFVKIKAEIKSVFTMISSKKSKTNLNE